MAYFDGVKTSAEARTKLFMAVEGKSAKEIKQIREEYAKIVSPIIQKELKENEGWMTNGYSE